MKAEFTALTGSVCLDRKERKRAFQNPAQQYGSIVKQVLQNTQNSAYILTVSDQEIAKPLYQYQETDWQFLKQLASSLGLSLVSDSSFFLSAVLHRHAFGYTAGTSGGQRS